MSKLFLFFIYAVTENTNNVHLEKTKSNVVNNVLGETSDLETKEMSFTQFVEQEEVVEFLVRTDDDYQETIDRRFRPSFDLQISQMTPPHQDKIKETISIETKNTMVEVIKFSCV